jgi:hypothetical protein
LRYSDNNMRKRPIISFYRLLHYLGILFLSAPVLLTYAQASDQRVISPEPLPSVYLPNPGIGWQNLAGEDDPILPETVAYLRRSDISWRILNPEPAVYAWHILDDLIDAAVEVGKQVSFRVYTMRGEVFGGHQVPEWVLERGAEIIDEDEPNYSNCVYQKEWGGFVNAFRSRYDGHPHIAFIDISGYGNFNEWSWQLQTEWDNVWDRAYSQGTADASTMETIDSQARRRLADAFIGGQVEDHRCYDAAGEIRTTSYDYPGFQQTQLVMPFAGIRQSTQYVFSRRQDVGFRFDCLGRPGDADGIMEGLGDELDQIWRNAPVVFELCSYVYRADNEMREAADLLRRAHGSLVHDNMDIERDPEVMERLMAHVGYRFVLNEIRFPAAVSAGDGFAVEMDWYNDGYAPVYPRMGQDFELRLALTDDNGTIEALFPLDADIATWMPADIIGTSPPRYSLRYELQAPPLAAGAYNLEVAIVDRTTQQPIHLAIEGRQDSGYYSLEPLTIE